MKTNIYDQITNQIIKSLEEGVAPWNKSWETGAAIMPLRSTGEAYKGINILNLWLVSDKKGYDLPHWFTYKQAQSIGANVKKGEKGTTVVYFKKIVKTAKNAEGVEETSAFPLMKCYSVFNACQIENLPEKFMKKAVPLTEKEKLEVMPSVQAFFDSLGLKLSHEGGRAFYRPSSDSITMPEMQDFNSSESYYATLAHEVTHWTKHPERCNRDLGRKKWGDKGYALEELVAELGAAFLCATLGISIEPRADHAEYIASWLEVLKNDNRAIFTASGYAQKAVTYLETVNVEDLAQLVA